MSRELRTIHTTGKVVYCHVYSDDGLLLYNGASGTFALPSSVSATDWADSSTAIGCTEEALSTSESLAVYVCSLPSALFRFHGYLAVFRELSGASPVATDPVIGTQTLDAESVPACIQTAVNDASATSTTATLDHVDPMPDALVGWLLTVQTEDLAGQTVSITASTAAGQVTYDVLSAAPDDDDPVTLRPPASL